MGEKEKEIYGYLDTNDKFNMSGMGHNNTVYDKNSIRSIPFKGVNKEKHNSELIAQKSLSNPDTDMDKLRKLCVSAPRTTLFYKSSVSKDNNTGKERKISKACNEADWLHYAQHVWENMLCSQNFYDFCKMMND